MHEGFFLYEAKDIGNKINGPRCFLREAFYMSLGVLYYFPNLSRPSIEGQRRSN